MLRNSKAPTETTSKPGHNLCCISSPDMLNYIKLYVYIYNYTYIYKVLPYVPTTLAF